MSFVDKDYYKNIYLGADVPTEEFDKLEKRAEVVINTLTGWKIEKSTNGLTDFDEFIQTQIKNATCAEIEYLLNNGIETLTTGEGANAQEVTIGGFHYGSKTANETKAQNTTTSLVLMYLDATGLLVKGGVSVGFI